MRNDTAAKDGPSSSTSDARSCATSQISSAKHLQNIPQVSKLTMKNLKSLALIGLLILSPLAAKAGLLSEYIGPETGLVAPDLLPAVGQKFEPMKSIHYFKREGMFNIGFPVGAEARVQVPKNFSGSVFVDFKSKLIGNAVREALISKGVTIAASEEAADLVLGGTGIYRVHLLNTLVRQIELNASFDTNKKSDSILEAGIAGKGLGNSAMSIAAASGLGPLLASLFEATMDLSGATAAMDKKYKWAEEARKEVFFTFGDCYEKSTRTATCSSPATRNSSYVHKVRLQYVDFTVAMKERGKDSRLINLVARKIDARSETDSDLAELLSMAIQEMVAQFPESRKTVDTKEVLQPVAN